jgi:lipid-binding SYLF domain-containing protein
MLAWVPIAGAETEQETQAQATLERFKSVDAGIADLMEGSVGYVVFPEIEKGAILVGAAHGKGVVYEGGEMVGTATVSQGTVGLQLGAQVYSQLMFFGTQPALDQFKANKWAWHGEASAVAAKSGAAASTEFKNGVAIFITDQKGAMASLSVGGQKFEFTPK